MLGGVGAALWWCALTGCGRRDCLALGYLGTLSGRYADLGASGLNGTLLAIEQANASGGVQGCRLKLVEADDGADEAEAIQAFQRLHAAGCAAIVGPMISKTALPVVPLANAARLVLMGPTVSTNELSGRDDYFFRVYTASAHTSRQLARIVYGQGGRRVLGIYDLSNRAHTENAYKAFAEEFVQLGGVMAPPQRIEPGSNRSFMSRAAAAAETGADTLFVLCSTLDTALLCQSLRKIDYHPRVVCTDWSGTHELLQFGGKSSDGLIFLHSMDLQGTSSFHTAYEARFGDKPDFGAMRAYEAATVLITALRRDPNPARLKETLLAIRAFPGVQTPIVFDAAGDVNRPHFAFVFQHAEFTPLAPTP